MSAIKLPGRGPSTDAFREMDGPIHDCVIMSKIAAQLMSDADDGKHPELCFAVLHLNQMLENPCDTTMRGTARGGPNESPPPISPEAQPATAGGSPPAVESVNLKSTGSPIQWSIADGALTSAISQLPPVHRTPAGVSLYRLHEPCMSRDKSCLRPRRVWT